MNAPTTRAARPTNRTISFKSVALPAEHGSWSLVAEPIVLGLLVAPSWAGLVIVVAAFALFLFNRPFKVFWTDTRKGKRYERTVVARRFAVAFGAVALVGFALALLLAGWRPFAPYLLAAPLMLVFMVYDQRPGRHWQAELTAPVAFAAVVSVVALAGGMDWIVALALWGFMIARSVPAVLFVRAWLRLNKGKPAAPWGTMVAHVAAVVAVVALVAAGWLPWTAGLAAALLLGRAIWGLSRYRWRASIKALGFLETGFGLLAVLLVAIGFWIG